jgi:hypothetical protein
VIFSIFFQGPQVINQPVNKESEMRRSLSVSVYYPGFRLELLKNTEKGLGEDSLLCGKNADWKQLAPECNLNF